MTKQFKNFKSAFDWTKKVIDDSKKDATSIIAEQVYKDSNEFTYRESGDMYESGELHSNFEKGIIIERIPYVRRRYYEGGKAGTGNVHAQPRWFDKTISKYKKDYQQMAINCINKAKKG